MTKDHCGTHEYVLGLCTEEQKRFEAWQAKHLPNCTIPMPKVTEKNPLGWSDCVNTSRFTIILRPSSLGPGVEAVCNCGAREDITHIEHM